ncbi:MAG: TlpA family protein disulfide reductase [Thermoplasmatota archaeon]
MGKSYAEKMKARSDKGSGNGNRSRRVVSKGPKKEGREDRFPLAPVVVIGVILVLLVSSIALYMAQNTGGDDNGTGDGDDNGSGNDNPVDSDHPYLGVSLETLDQGTITLQRYAGRVVIIDMFATWCQPCHLQMAELIELEDSYSGSDLVILSVDTDLQETSSDVRQFKAQYPEADWTFALSNQVFNGYFEAKSIPTMFILDRSGRIVDTHVGVTSADDLARKITPLI